MDTKLLSIKPAAKLFGIAEKKLYRLVEEKRCPFVEIETLTGTIQRKINTRTFADWLDQLAREHKAI